MLLREKAPFKVRHFSLSWTELTSFQKMLLTSKFENIR